MIEGVRVNIPKEYEEYINPVLIEEIKKSKLPVLSAGIKDEAKQEVKPVVQDEYKPTYWTPIKLKDKYSMKYSTQDEKAAGERLKSKLEAKGYDSSDINYMLELARRESRYGLNTESEESKKHGAQGIWQFTPGTLKDMGFDISRPLTEDEQIDAIGRYIAKSKEKAMPLVNENRSIYSILGGMHLGGITGGYKYFTEDNYNPNDGNTSIRDYVEHFGKYDF